MSRRLGLASILVVVFAFAGAAAGPVRPLQTLRIAVSIGWQHAPEQVKLETRPLAPPAWPLPVATALVPQSVGFSRSLIERALFQRPPPTTL